MIADATGRIIDCNPQFAMMIGLATPDELLGAALRELEAEPGALYALAERLDGVRDSIEELTLLRSDGARLRVLAHVATDPHLNGEVGELRGYLIDITRRTGLEVALSETNERHQLVERATSDVTWEWVIGTGHVSWSEAGPRRFRYAPDEVRSSIEWHTDRIHREDRERVVSGLNAAVSGVGQFWSDEYRLLRGDGTFAVVFDRAHIVRNERSDALRVVGCMVDMTERRRAEESQRFLVRAGSILESTLNIKRNLARLARLCVPAVAGCCLIDLLEPDGSLTHVATVHHDRRRARELRREAGSRDGGRHAAVDRVIRTGEALLISDAASKSWDEAGWGANELALVGARSYMIVPMRVRRRVVGAITLCNTQPGGNYQPVDLIVAEKIAHHAALAVDNARLYNAARRALRSRREVLALVSHDLRTPLQTISATTSLLRDHLPNGDEGAARWLDVLDRAIDQMNGLIGDLLDMASMEAGHFSVRLSSHGARDLLFDTRELLEPLTKSKNIALEMYAEDDVGAVLADPTQILRVIENLVSNAVKFTPAGGRMIVRVGQREGWVRFEVEDTGPGIPVDQRSHVFERFWQGDGYDRRGAGLGLAIARGIVEAHEGRIGVEGAAGGGSIFWFALPTEEINVRRSLPGIPTPDRRADDHRQLDEQVVVER